jgi:hypothetical protein
MKGGRVAEGLNLGSALMGILPAPVQALMGALADATSITTVFYIASFLPALGLLAFLLPNHEALKPS